MNSSATFCGNAIAVPSDTINLLRFFWTYCTLNPAGFKRFQKISEDMKQVWYFALSLALSLVISGTLLAGLVKSLQINWARKNRRPVSFLTPVILTGLFILLSLYLTVPRLLDTVSMASGSYIIEEISLSNGDIGWNSLNSGQRSFFYNQWRFHPATGKTYRVSFTPHSLYIVSMSEVMDTSESQK
jgi:hypothetical protein